jgi:uncharacterized cupredoxin-like copper-binding protein
MRKRLLALFVGLAGVVAATALAATQMGPTVAVSLKEFKVMAPSSTKAGKVTFAVRNRGKLKHEFIVVKTNRPAGKLPLKGAVARLTGVKGKLKPFKPGSLKKLTLTLKSGKYVLLCNLPGHYKAGQYKAFRVS